MANMRVTCPTCRSELEVDDAHEGQQVECGNCLQVFVAERPRPPAPARPAPVPAAKPARKPPRRSDDRPRSRRRADEDDYEEDYAPPPRRTTNDGNGLALASMILGLVAVPIMCCWPVSLCLGLAAVITGALGLGSRDNQALAGLGLALGIIALLGSGFFFVLTIGPALGR
jgi:predicted Zn finger-like uncharacterized protein